MTWVTCRQASKLGARGKKLLSLIRSEKLARQVKEWTNEIFWIFVYTQHVHTHVQSLNRLNWESNSRLAQNEEQKRPRESQNSPFPILLRINFPSIYFVQYIEVVNVCVFSKYINQLSAKSSLIPCNVILPKKWQFLKFLRNLKTIRAGFVFYWHIYMAWIRGQDFSRTFVLKISKEMRFSRRV